MDDRRATAPDQLRGCFFVLDLSMPTELEYDERAEAVARGLSLDPKEHRILPDGYWLAQLKRLSRRKDLLLYFHRHTRQFVLAVWLYPPGLGARIVSEIEARAWHPDAGGWDVLEFTQRLKMTLDGQVSHMRRKLRDQHQAKKDARAEDLEERNSMCKYLRNKGLAQEANLISSGVLPWVGRRLGGEHLEQVKEQLKEMASYKERVTRSIS